ncbi:MAG: flagellar hook-basal body complex protein [Rhodospirillaceae bacterium]
MSLNGTFSTAVLALNAQQRQLATIGENIANVQTTAYKEKRTSFKTLLNDVTGTNKSFYAVNSVQTRAIDRQGTLATTNRNFDLAVNGKGLFITKDLGLQRNVLPQDNLMAEWQYTRDGALVTEGFEFPYDTDGDGINNQGIVLKTTAGNTLYAWGPSVNGVINQPNDVSQLVPVTIDLEQTLPARPTSTMSLQGNVSVGLLNNLASSRAGVLKQNGTNLPFIDADGNDRRLTLEFNQAARPTSTISVEGNVSRGITTQQSVDLSYIDADGQSRDVTVAFDPVLSDGSATGAYTLSGSGLDSNNQPVDVSIIPASAKFDSFGVLQTPNDGLFTVTINDAAGPQVVTLDLSQTTQLAGSGNVDVTNVLTNGTAEIFTPLPNRYTLNVESLDINNTPVPVTIEPLSVTFDSTGQLQVPRNGQFTVTIQDATGPQVITMDLLKLTQLAGNGNVELQYIKQDGLKEGILTSTFFDRSGTLYGKFSNNGTIPLYKLPLANFPAENKLEAISGNLFKYDPLAGQLDLRAVGQLASIAQIVTGALERSNINLSDQFTKMIVTQRAYSSSATVLKTADEMTQQARDLKR